MLACIAHAEGDDETEGMPVWYLGEAQKIIVAVDANVAITTSVPPEWENLKDTVLRLQTFAFANEYDGAFANTHLVNGQKVLALRAIKDQWRLERLVQKTLQQALDAIDVVHMGDCGKEKTVRFVEDNGTAKVQQQKNRKMNCRSQTHEASFESPTVLLSSSPLSVLSNTPSISPNSVAALTSAPPRSTKQKLPTELGTPIKAKILGQPRITKVKDAPSKLELKQPKKGTQRKTKQVYNAAFHAVSDPTDMEWTPSARPAADTATGRRTRALSRSGKSTKS